MKLAIRIFSIWLVSALLVCCRDNRGGEVGVTTLYPLEQTKLVNDIAPFVDQMEIVPIAPDERTFMNSVSKAVRDEAGNFYLLDFTGNLVALKPDGTFLRTVARKGRGPREYIKIEDIAISNDGEYLMTLGPVSIQCYGIKDTTLYREIPHGKLSMPFDALAPSGDDGAYLFAAFPAESKDYAASKPMLFRINGKGALKGEYLPREDVTISMGNITQIGGNSYIIKPQSSEHIAYRLDPDGISPYYKIDFGNKNIPSYRDKAVTNIGDYISAPYYKLPMSFQQTDSALYFKAAGPKMNGNNFLYSISSGSGIRWLDADVPDPVSFIASDEEYFYIFVPAAILGRDKGLCPLSEYIVGQARKAGLAAKDNPAIAKVRFNPAARI